MFRFFVEKKVGSFFELTPSVLKHIQVARIQKENFICIYKNNFYEVKLENNQAKIIQKINKNHEFNEELILAPSLIKWKKFDLLVQKAAELGVSKLVPVISKNISVNLNVNLEKKLLRWNEIAKNACEQAFRNKQMVVEKPITFENVLNFTKNNKYIAYEKTIAKMELTFTPDSLFLIGPEGGFTEKEVALAKNKDFTTISLGKRILRAETASFFVLSRVN